MNSQPTPSGSLLFFFFLLLSPASLARHKLGHDGHPDCKNDVCQPYSFAIQNASLDAVSKDVRAYQCSDPVTSVGCVSDKPK